MNVLYIENYLLLLYDFDRDEAPKPTTALDYTFGRRAKTGHNIVSLFPIKSFIVPCLTEELDTICNSVHGIKLEERKVQGPVVRSLVSANR